MQRGVGGPVGEVADIVRPGPGELVARMEARDLDLPDQPGVRQRIVREVEEGVVVGEVLEHVRMDEQRRVHQRRIGHVQGVQLGAEVVEQRIVGPCLADHVADLAADVHRLGERTEVEADDGLLEPKAGGDDDRVRGEG